MDRILLFSPHVVFLTWALLLHGLPSVTHWQHCFAQYHSLQDHEIASDFHYFKNNTNSIPRYVVKRNVNLSTQRLVRDCS